MRFKEIKLVFALLGLVFLLFFSNDFGLIDIEKTAIITAVAVDLSENGEYKIGLRSVSAPVYSGDGPAQYAIGTVGLFRNTRSDEFRRAVVSTTEIAGAFSSALGRRRG